MEFIHELGEPDSVDRCLLGGKGFVLSRLRRGGFPVPPGFVVTTDAYRVFLTENGLRAPVEATCTESRVRGFRVALERASIPSSVCARVCAAYRALGVDEVAVRSSAVAEDRVSGSFAGQFGTLLYVSGCKQVLLAIRHCWASLWTESALSYMQRVRGHGDDPAMAVVVQAMVDAACSGVAFTLDPVSGDRDVILVEVVAGGGGSLVAGTAVPDRYRISRSNKRARVRAIRAGFSGLDEVVRIAQAIEAWAGRPQDIEWAIDGRGQVRVLQARPITAAGDGGQQVVARWTRDNVGEVLPDPLTPLSWSILDPMTNSAFVKMLTRLGVRDDRDTLLFGLFHGRVYLNQTRFQGLVSRFHPSRAGFRAFPQLVLTGFRALWLLWRLPGEGQAVMGNVLACEASTDATDLAACTRQGLMEHLTEWRALCARVMQVHIPITTLASVLYQAVDKMLLWWAPGVASVVDVTAGTFKMYSAEAGRALAVLAGQVCEDDELCSAVLGTPVDAWEERLAETPAGRALWARLQRFLDDHGHMAAQEFELMVPRWREAPAVVFKSFQRQVRAALRGPTVDGSLDPGDVALRVRQRLGVFKRWVFGQVLRLAQTFTATRENLKYCFVIAYGHVRECYVNLASRLVHAGVLGASGDIFFLTADEINALVSAGTCPVPQAEVTTRREAWEREAQGKPPFALEQRRDGQTVVATSAKSGRRADGLLLRGVGGSAGLYTGRARVVRSPEDADLAPGEVLVAAATNPSWAPLFTVAGALVTEIGGVLSHGAIIAREYGVPAVLNIPEATERIRTGSLITVNGSEGTVRLLEEGQ